MSKSKVAAPPAAKPKLCISKVRDVAEIKVCNFKLKTSPVMGDICPNRENHLYPVLTGFCHSGWHEGIAAVTASGAPAPTCKHFINCPCDCHAKLNRMFALTGDERRLVDNSTWKPESTFVMPSLEPLTVESSNPVSINPRPVVESPAPGIVPASVARSFEPTDSGRAGRGELEAWVREVTDIWAVERDALCTVGYISREIGRKRGISPPSEGAIQNVLKRWKDLGFASVEMARPMRFTGYTEEGIRFGLDNLKARAKRQNK